LLLALTKIVSSSNAKEARNKINVGPSSKLFSGRWQRPHLVPAIKRQDKEYENVTRAPTNNLARKKAQI
jgi:hypothetical protein